MKEDEADAGRSTAHGLAGHLHEALTLAHALADRLAHAQLSEDGAPYSLRLTRALTADVVDLLEEETHRG